MSSLRVLAVHSYAVQGTASLKASISILGSAVLPVPSLILSGLTNLPGIVKTQVPFQELLYGSLDLAKIRNQKLILYIGYLGSTEQVKIIERAITDYRDIIREIVVDPVTGDHGRLYVPEEILESWPRLLSLADWALPNITEVCIYSGLEPSASIEEHIQAFRERFTELSSIVTSLPCKEGICLELYHQCELFRHTHRKLTKNYGGSGDSFAADFIKGYYFLKLSARDAMVRAAEKTISYMELSIAKGSDDLEIIPDLN